MVGVKAGLSLATIEPLNIKLYAILTYNTDTDTDMVLVDTDMIETDTNISVSANRYIGLSLLLSQPKPVKQNYSDWSKL